MTPGALPSFARGLIAEQDLGIPVTISNRDGRALTVADLLAHPEEGVDPKTLGDDPRTMLARLALTVMPGFRVALPGSGIVDQTRAITEIDQRTRDGRAVRNVVFVYLEGLATRVFLRRRPYQQPELRMPNDAPEGERVQVATPGRDVLVIDGGDDGSSPDLVSRRMSLHAALKPAHGNLVLCTGDSATRDRVAAALQGSVGLIVGFGHGDPSEFFGCVGMDPIFAAGSSAASLVAQKIVHLTGCEAAAELGPDLVKTHGAIAFFGYIDRVTYPASGAAAAAAIQAIANVSKLIAEGCYADDVHERAINGFLSFATEFQDSDPIAAASFVSMSNAFRSPVTSEDYGSRSAVLTT